MDTLEFYVEMGVYRNPETGQYQFNFPPYRVDEENGAQPKYPEGPYPRSHHSYTLEGLLDAMAHPVINWEGRDRNITHIKELLSDNYHGYHNLRAPVYPIEEYISRCRYLLENPEPQGLCEETMRFCFGLRNPGKISVTEVFFGSVRATNVLFIVGGCEITYPTRYGVISVRIRFDAKYPIHRHGSDVYLVLPHGKSVTFTPSVQA